MQPAQDINIAAVDQDSYQFTLQDPNLDELNNWAQKSSQN